MKGRLWRVLAKIRGILKVLVELGRRRVSRMSGSVHVDGGLSGVRRVHWRVEELLLMWWRWKKKLLTMG